MTNVNNFSTQFKKFNEMLEKYTNKLNNLMSVPDWDGIHEYAASEEYQKETMDVSMKMMVSFPHINGVMQMYMNPSQGQSHSEFLKLGFESRTILIKIIQFTLASQKIMYYDQPEAKESLESFKHIFAPMEEISLELSNLVDKNLPETSSDPIDVPDGIEGLLLLLDNLIIKIDDAIIAKDFEKLKGAMECEEAGQMMMLLGDSEYATLTEDVFALVGDLTEDSAATKFAALDEHARSIAGRLIVLIAITSEKCESFNFEECVAEIARVREITQPLFK